MHRTGSHNGSEGPEKILITRACDTCRKKKIRCQQAPSSDVCMQCIKSKMQCHFTPISVLKHRRRMTRDRRVEILEKRLAWMEDQLSSHERQQFQRDPSSIDPERQPRVLDITEQPPKLLVHAAGISSPSFHEDNNALVKGMPIFQELPSKEKAGLLITSYFQRINVVHPIFDQNNFMARFDSTYGLDCSSDPGWWAALNVVFALAYQDWGTPDPSSQDDIEAWGYFQNALAAIDQVMTRHYTLASVQALLGLAMIMMAMPYQQQVTSLTSSAVKIAHSLGLHRQHQDPMLDSTDSAERSRVFWIAYSLDKDISLQTRQPPTQSEEDMDVEPPSRDDATLVQHRGIRHDLFYFRTRLAIIQGQIYRQLLSVRAGKQSAGERTMAAEELETSLQNWRRSVPLDLLRDYSPPALDGSPLEYSPHPVYLQLLYFKTLAVIHEALPTLPWYHEIENTEIRAHILSARVTYPGEARSAMRLFSVTPRRKLACVWTTLHIFTTAATTLLIHTISNPSDPFIQTDLRLLEPFLNLLGILVAQCDVKEDIVEMYHSSMILFDQARMIVEHSGMEVRVPRESSSEKESVEDFLERMERTSAGDDIGIGLVA